MFTLTAPIPMPNVNRWRAIQWKPVPNEARAVVVAEVLSPGASPRSLKFPLNIRNGECDQLVQNAAALSWDDSFSIVQVDRPNGYTDFDAAAQGTGQVRVRAIESFLATNTLVNLGAGAVT